MPSTRAPSSMRAFTLRALHDGAAARAGALVQAREEAVEHRRELLLDVGEREELLVQALTAALAVPLEPIELARAAGPPPGRARWVPVVLRALRSAPVRGVLRAHRHREAVPAGVRPLLLEPGQAHLLALRRRHGALVR